MKEQYVLWGAEITYQTTYEKTISFLSDLDKEWPIECAGKNEKITHTALSSGGSNFLHSRGWVKEESLDKFRDNFNEECFQIFKFSVSVEHLMIS